MDFIPNRKRESSNRSEKLRSLLGSPELEFFIESHNGISARIAEEAGFAGIWASGLTMSASMGLPDNNKATLTEILQLVENMADTTSLPILVDGDSGYGDFSNVQRLVEKLEQRGAAGVCIEDKEYPKRNSFVQGFKQKLANIDEFCGKIKAAKDAQHSQSFVVVARIEAFIVGQGLDEALHRASSYLSAGADAILIHSAQSSADEILAFKENLRSTAPVIIVPTKYYSTPTDVFVEAGFSICIWANQLLRASVDGMQSIAKLIKQEKSIRSAEYKIASIEEIFRLQGQDKLLDAEDRYTSTRRSPRVVLLAATRGEELGDLTLDIPKAMIHIGSMPLISRTIEVYKSLGLAEISVVRGYKKEAFNLDQVTFFDNNAYMSTGEAKSLWEARSSLVGACIISYGDVLFRKHVLTMLLDMIEDFVIAVDTEWAVDRNRGKKSDLVLCSEPHSRASYHKRVLLSQITEAFGNSDVHGEWMGILYASETGAFILKNILDLKHELGVLDSLTIPDLLNELVADGHEVRVVYTTGHWIDVDTVSDLLAAAEFL